MGKKTAKQKMFAITPRATGPQRHRATLGLADARAYRVWCRDNGFGPSAQKSWRQRRQEQRHAAKLAVRAEAADVLDSHICKLGLSSLAAYKAWCGEHGFTTAERKSAAQREQETQAAQREHAADALRASARTLQSIRRAEEEPQAWIRAIFDRRMDASELPSPLLKSLHTLAAAEKNAGVRQAFEELLLAVSRQARPLMNAQNLPWFGPQASATYLHGLLALARRRDAWRREVSEWRPTRAKAPRLFGSLARHLLARYAVPVFMDRAWFEGDTHVARQHQDWFIHVGVGGSVRAVDTPFALTKLAAHHVLRAPANFTFEAALRWGQVRGMGGADRLARDVAASLLADAQPDEPFWTSVIHWLVNHPELESRDIGPIMDFIYNVRYVPQEVMRADGGIEYAAPAEPAFDMKGRTPAALLRRVSEWHQQLARQAYRSREWPRLEAGEFHLQQHDAHTEGVLHWTIRELVCSRDLEEEGQAMNNCVASYIRKCTEGQSSIWSLRVMAPDAHRPQRVMTIEVDPRTRQIVQARGKCNLLPGSPKSPARLKLAPTFLRRWAAQQGMSLSPYACED